MGDVSNEKLPRPPGIDTELWNSIALLGAVAAHSAMDLLWGTWTLGRGRKQQRNEDHVKFINKHVLGFSDHIKRHELTDYGVEPVGGHLMTIDTEGHGRTGIQRNDPAIIGWTGTDLKVELPVHKGIIIADTVGDLLEQPVFTSLVKAVRPDNMTFTSNFPPPPEVKVQEGWRHLDHMTVMGKKVPHYDQTAIAHALQFGVELKMQIEKGYYNPLVALDNANKKFGHQDYLRDFVYPFPAQNAEITAPPRNNGHARRASGPHPVREHKL